MKNYSLYYIYKITKKLITITQYNGVKLHEKLNFIA